MSDSFAFVGGKEVLDSSLMVKYAKDLVNCVFVYKRNSVGKWVQTQRIVDPDTFSASQFGFSIDAEGKTLLVGDRSKNYDFVRYAQTGEAYVYELNNGLWELKQRLLAPLSLNATGIGGNVLIEGDVAIVCAERDAHDEKGENYIGGAGGGAVYIFRKDGTGAWYFQQKITSPTREIAAFFGSKVTLNDGKLVIAAPRESYVDTVNGSPVYAKSGTIYLYVEEQGTWVLKQKIPSPSLKNNVALGASVFLRDRKLFVGGQENYEPYFASDGDKGIVYQFELDSTEQFKYKQAIRTTDTSNARYFGSSVKTSDDKLIVSSLGRNEFVNGIKVYWAGGVHLYRSVGERYVESKLYSLKSPRSSDFFGHSTAFRNGNILIGVPRRDSVEATGADAFRDEGRVYALQICETVDTLIVRDCERVIHQGDTFYNDTSMLYTMNASRCDSILRLIAKVDMSYRPKRSISDTTCKFYKSPSGKYVWTSTGVYQDTLTNPLGCDSVIVVDLTVRDKIDTAVIKVGNVLTAQGQDSYFRWLRCDSNYSFTGDTGAVFQPANSGLYAVEAKRLDCTDTSSCYSVIGTGVHYANTELNYFVYPNPTTGRLNISIPNNSAVEVALHDMSGRQLGLFQVHGGQILSLETPDQKGIYYLQFVTHEGLTYTRKVVKL